MKQDMDRYCSFMEKKANVLNKLVLAFSAGGQMTGSLLTMGLAISALAGGSAGYAASSIGSPGQRNFRNTQRDFLDHKLRTEVASRTRDLALDDMHTKATELDKPARSMRI